jgi:nicotinamidase-related amidase
LSNGYVTESNLGDKCASWLERIAPYNVHDYPLDGPNSALIVIDMQRFFVKEGCPTFLSAGKAITGNLTRLVEKFRRAGRPVIFTRHVHKSPEMDGGILAWWWGDMCMEGSEDSAVCDELRPQEAEKVILKRRYSAFFNTELDTVLRCLEIRDLVITGVMTNICCESTARDAYFRDYRIHFLADGTATADEDLHIATLMNVGFGFARVTTSSRILAELR